MFPHAPSFQLTLDASRHDPDSHEWFHAPPVVRDELSMAALCRAAEISDDEMWETVAISEVSKRPNISLRVVEEAPWT